MKRCAGILCPISALPSRFGIGDFGVNSYRFVDLLEEADFHLWQILPLNPLGYGHSPYQPFSSFALDELYVDLEALWKDGLIEKPVSYNEMMDRVHYEDIRIYKTPYLDKAYKTALSKDPQCLEEFISIHPWVKNWSVFMSMKRSERLAGWDHWPKDKQDKIQKGYEGLSKEEKFAADYEIWLQKTLYEQWFKLKSYANQKDIRIIGDLPFYVGYDSCDVYEAQDEFLLGENKEPAWIAGVPPDYFSKTGQRWGNPIYNWERLRKEGYSLILNRIKRNASLYDILRLDHFRAFDTYWKIPASCPTAVDGSWVEAPGYEVFDKMFKEIPNVDIIAEDLGDLRKEVLTLRDHYNFPGMNVVEFTFHDAEINHDPQWKKENMVAYLGTHDNDTMKGYFLSLPEEEKNAWLSSLNQLGFTDGDIVDKMIAYELSLPAGYALLSLQDVLKLGSEARLNVPSVIDNINWTWRITCFDEFEKRLPSLHTLLEKYHRL